MLYILIRLLISKRWKNIFHNAIAFIIGFLLAVIPGVVYCLSHGILMEMLDAVFRFGMDYAKEDGLINWFFLQPDKLIFVLPLLLPSVIALFTSHKNRAIKQLLWLDFAVLTVGLSMGRSYPHYFTLIIPHVALGFIMLAHDICSEDFKPASACKYILIICVCLLSLSGMIIQNGGLFLWSTMRRRGTDYNAISIAQNIDESEKDSVYTYGIDSRWYVETGIYPCIKYCDWQKDYIRLNPEIQDELIEIFHSDPPKWVVTRKNEQPEFLQEILDRQYTLYEENDAYILWSLTRV